MLLGSNTKKANQISFTLHLHPTIFQKTEKFQLVIEKFENCQ